MEWVTHQSGVVAIESVTHSRVEDNQSLPIYKVNDQLRYTINFKPGHSIPLDGQVEFVMLDPYLRVPLLAQPDQPNSLSATFRAPDQHGVFTFSFDYRRAGYSSISHKTTVSIAPPRHDQFDRFITGAGPFYLGAGSVALATLSLIAIWSSA
jgi:oligosaccharyltransferase complex subunit beta